MTKEIKRIILQKHTFNIRLMRPIEVVILEIQIYLKWLRKTTGMSSPSRKGFLLKKKLNYDTYKC